MTYYLYADVILVNNFVMDFLLLTVVRKLLHLEARKFGRVLASTAGAMYALAVLFYPLSKILLLSSCVGMSVLLVALAFRLHGKGEFFRAVTGLYLTSVLTAGVMEWFRSFGWLSQIWLYGAAALLGVWAVSELWTSVSVGAVRQQHLYQVELWLGGKQKTLTAFLDTGNHLTEPISGKPVSVLWAGAAQELLSGTEGFFCIPFHSVGQEHGILQAVRADRMEIQLEGFRQVIEHPYIAISEHPLSQKGSYQMLLHEKMW